MERSLRVSNCCVHCLVPDMSRPDCRFPNRMTPKTSRRCTRSFELGKVHLGQAGRNDPARDRDGGGARPPCISRIWSWAGAGRGGFRTAIRERVAFREPRCSAENQTPFGSAQGRPVATKNVATRMGQPRLTAGPHSTPSLRSVAQGRLSTAKTVRERTSFSARHDISEWRRRE